MPENIKKQILKNLKKYLSKSKDVLQPLKIKAYDRVELMVEKEKYAKFGIHKGDQGCVMGDYAVKNCIEVDFSGISENGDFYGYCILVNIDDLKKI